MRNTIERKMLETTIHAFSVKIVDGVPDVQPIEPVIVYGKISHANAVKAVKRKHPELQGITVSKIESEEVRFEIDVETFIANAHKIEKKQEETTNI